MIQMLLVLSLYAKRCFVICMHYTCLSQVGITTMGRLLDASWDSDELPDRKSNCSFVTLRLATLRFKQGAYMDT